VSRTPAAPSEEICRQVDRRPNQAHRRRAYAALSNDLLGTMVSALEVNLLHNCTILLAVARTSAMALLKT